MKARGEENGKKILGKPQVIEGKHVLSYKSKEKKPVEEYLKMQGRFAHMFKPGNEWMIEQVQKEVDRNWEELLKLCEL